MSEAEDIRLALAIRWAPERYIEHAKRAYEKRTGRQASPEWVRALRRRMREAPIPNNPADAVGPEVIEALRRMRLLPQRAQPRASRVPAITDHIRAALERGTSRFSCARTAAAAMGTCSSSGKLASHTRTCARSRPSSTLLTRAASRRACHRRSMTF